MANPSRIKFLHRITRGSEVDPWGAGLDPGPESNPANGIETVISGIEIVTFIRQLDSGILTTSEIVAEYNLTHPDDASDLGAMGTWFNAATDKNSWLTHFEGRLSFAREKNPGVNGLDGRFGYAVPAVLFHGFDGVHSLSNSRPDAAHQFNNWA